VRLVMSEGRDAVVRRLRVKGTSGGLDARAG
jgi:hypothetical protein